MKPIMIQKRNFDAIYSSFVIGVVKTLFKNLLSLSSVIEDETIILEVKEREGEADRPIGDRSQIFRYEKQS